MKSDLAVLACLLGSYALGLTTPELTLFLGAVYLGSQAFRNEYSRRRILIEENGLMVPRGGNLEIEASTAARISLSLIALMSALSLLYHRYPASEFSLTISLVLTPCAFTGLTLASRIFMTQRLSRSHEAYKQASISLSPSGSPLPSLTKSFPVVAASHQSKETPDPELGNTAAQLARP